MDGFLPIGSVVLLKGAQKKLMIIGRFQVSVKTEKIYDYSGCLYPEGFMNPQDLFLFQNDDIEKVYEKYGLSIEGRHAGFAIRKYNKKDVEDLRVAAKHYIGE